MAQIDALARFLVDQRGHQLLIPGDDNCQITDDEGGHPLNRVMSAAEVAALLEEVLPEAMRAARDAGEPVAFSRRTDAGEFRIRAERATDGLRVTLTRAPRQYVEELALLARQSGAADLVLSEGCPAHVRREGVFGRLPEGITLPPGALAAFFPEVAPEGGTGPFLLDLGPAGRARGASVQGPDGPALAIRLLAAEALPLEGIPPAFRDLLLERAGLILAAAPPGQGLTHLLAGLVALIAASATIHIVWLERLAELPTPSGQALVSRCAPGPGRPLSGAIAEALALRPEVLVVDEIPNEAAALAALEGAHAGCLVVAGCRAPSVVAAVARVLGLAPPHRRLELRDHLCEHLAGGVAQILCPGTDGRRQPARDVLVASEASARAIRDGHLEDLSEGIHAVGFSRDDSLLRLVAEGKVAAEVAERHALDRKRFRENLAARAARRAAGGG